MSIIERVLGFALSHHGLVYGVLTLFAEFISFYLAVFMTVFNEEVALELHGLV